MSKKSINKLLTPKRMLIAIIFLCIILIVMSFFTTAPTTGLRNAFSYIVTPLQRGINLIGHGMVQEDERKKTLSDLEEENTSLKERVESLEAENAALREGESELNKLREFYSVDDSTKEWGKVAVNIIGKSSNNGENYYIIDRGKSGGIEPDMNVITDKGLVGIVTESYDIYSVVMPIVADGAKVSASDERTGDYCTVSGDMTFSNAGIIKVNDFKAAADISEGDRLVTSSISSKYLPGLFIGTISNIKTDGSSLTKSADVAPAVDFDHLSTVIVITTKKSDYTVS